MRNDRNTSSELKWIPDGFHFLDHEDSLRRKKILDQIYEFFTSRGYLEVTPPSFDFTNSFLSHVANSEEARILKSRDLSGREISPSIDLTLQVVKGLAGFGVKKGNQKVFYTGRIVKDNFKKNADRREILQAGAEIIGHSNANTFKMLLTHISELVPVLGLKEKITLVLGNTAIYSNIVEYLEFSEADKNTLSNLLYHKEEKSIRDFLDLRVKKKEIRDLILKLILSFELKEIKSDLISISKKYKIKLEPLIDETEEIFKYANHFKNLDLCMDYSLIRDLDYYTGFVFHGYYDRISYPVVTGGAYDHLFEKFSGEEKRACGFAVNIDIIEEINRR
ncbi:MAG TPA: ATP phosphoribosyltransferase regulatory subunit [Leptospiraceae bacterium]|nr:ATP phosphoribosyltransferase regulatory subunit [Leptospiraceae bacterium]HMW04308.1 ATP phosphoribosyltransferase regulatory subunit [Leptospiraceae bacterium]HMX30654.1 ATP phosphoribosyltransferase regulatory subunit [Leptospiraceae bacterium]HMY31354.1 ATP phosphoribosyltransferase regulatory subunit [Leptospiraceae bacterium]HMZ63609.1 ATP phosphoribosyltransferase regulatory subunit [Leptospiraceae bacterium]